VAPDLSGLATSNFALEVLDALPDATAVLNQAGTIIAVNRAWRMFTVDNGGRPETTGVGTNYLDVCSRAAATGCADASEVLMGLQAVLAGETVESDREYPCPSSTAGRWFNSRITPIGGSTGGAVVSHVNITRRIMSERALAHRSSHDPLTGLGNRVLFLEELTEALLLRPGRIPVADVGVLFIDLDQFKLVNDTYGHDAGDEVLLTVAHRLRSTIRPGDTIARRGGDEFTCCAPRMTGEGLRGLAQRIDATLAEPHRVHGKSLQIRGSVGSHLATAGDPAVEALARADQDMYLVKSRHKRSRSGVLEI
jgi:diguanylate cyclase (GGDEF)-like protein